MLLARISLALTAFAFAGFGMMLLMWPDAISLVGVELTSPAARVEIRGFYGGLELGLAVFFAVAAWRREWFRPALVAQIASLGGLVIGRLIGIVTDGTDDAFIYLLMMMEAAGCLIGVMALWQLRGVGSTWPSA